MTKNPRIRKWKKTKSFLRKLQTDNLSDLSASFSYYALLSLGPFSVGLVLASTFLPSSQIDGVFVWVEQLFGPSTRSTFEMVWAEAQRPGPRSLAGFLSLVGILLFSAAIFSQLQSSLNRIFRVRRRAIHQWLLKQLLSVALVFGLLIVLLSAAFLTSLSQALPAMSAIEIPRLIPWISLVVVGLGIAVLFRWLPDTHVGWRAALPSAFAVAIGMQIARSLFAFYLSSSTTLSLYGAAASFPIFLVWVYVTSFLFFLGAELAHFLNEKYPSI
jgi:membrane protein